MLLEYRLSTELLFDAPVTEHVFRLRLTPAEDARQTVLDAEVRIEPEAGLAPGLEPAFGNRTHFGRVQAPHTSLTYYAQGRVRTDAGRFDTREPGGYLRHPSSLTRLGPVLSQMADTLSAIVAADETTLSHLMMSAVHRAFVYTPGSTDVTTTAEEALARGCGVCQDYSHVLLALLRHRGIAARYVSGMLTGIGATHAWVEAWVDGRWLGLDPTHDALVDERYIVMARGADFNDAAIEHGTFRGNAVQTMNTSVTVTVIDEN